MDQFAFPIDGDLASIFFKAFAILLSVMYLLYAVVMTRQAQVMQQTVTNKHGKMIIFITSLQIIFALILIFLSIVYI